MKLLHVIGSMDPRAGGPCQGIRNLASRMLGGGNSVDVVCLDDCQADYLSRETLRIHALGRGSGSWNYHSALRPWLSRNLSRYDSVILNGLWQYPGYALSQVARQQGMPPYFIFPHGMLDPWFQQAPDRRLKAIRNWFYWKLIEQRVIRNAAALFFTCEEEMLLARKTFRPYHPKKEINIGYGVAAPPAHHPGMDRAFAEKCPAAKGQPYFLFLSRIHPKKGVDLLLKAYAAVCRLPETKGSPPRLVIAGPGLETAFGKEMVKLASDLCPAGSVLWPGMLTGDAKWGALYRSEAFVLPSHQENFGIAVVEALACGRPVLISNQINIWREINEHGAALVAEDTVAGTTRLLTDWIKLPASEKSQMASAAQPCFQNCFSVEITERNLVHNLVAHFYAQ